MAANIKQVLEDDGTIRYYLGDLHHNPEGPAVIGFAGRHKEYWFKGLRHRTDGPAVEYLDGDYEYFEQGRRHNLKAQPSVLMEWLSIGLMVVSMPMKMNII